MKKHVLKIITAAVFLLMITSCIPGDGAASPGDEAGFFSGIWHGWIAPVSLIISIFKHNISIYEVHNSGFWYDFGFYIAIIGGFGGLSLFRKKGKKKHRED